MGQDMKKFARGTIPESAGIPGRGLFALLLMFILIGGYFPIRILAASEKEPDLKVLVGKWVRPDGGYVIHVRDVKPDGTADAGYYNPRPIHVAEAKVSRQEGLAKVYIRLEGKGYPGSTYTLYHYAAKDALAGFYYQAVLDETFEVVFVRQNE
jgi:hypothetical protein